MVRRSPTGACQCSRFLARPRNPRSSRLATSTWSRALSSPASLMSSCSWQLPGQPPSTHSRSPWTVDTARPWAVWAWRLASYSTFWLVHPRGRCTRVPNPSTSTASPERASSESQQPSSARVVMKLPSGWQKPTAASSPSSRSMLSPTSVLEIPTMRPARRYDSPSSSTAATASRRISSGSGGVPPRPGGAGGARWARRAASQSSTVAGSDERGQYDDTGPDLLAGFETLPMVWSPSTSGHTEHHGHPYCGGGQRAGHRPGHIQPTSPVGWPNGGDQAGRGGGDADADRQVDEEYPPPAGVLDQQAAGQHAHGRAGPGDGRPHPQRPVALGALEGGSDDGQRRRRQQRRAHALAGAGGDQDRPGLGQARGQRGDGEYAEPGQEHPPLAERIGQPAAQQQQPAEAQRVGGDHPGQ